MQYDHTLRCTFMPPNGPWPVGWYWVILDQQRQPVTDWQSQDLLMDEY